MNKVPLSQFGKQQANFNLISSNIKIGDRQVTKRIMMAFYTRCFHIRSTKTYIEESRTSAIVFCFEISNTHEIFPAKIFPAKKTLI